MVKWQFFLKLAISGIQRGGQRSLAALLTVAFGVMSLIAMTNLSDSIHRVFVADGRASVGGDVQLYNQSRNLDSEAISQIEALQNQGLISQFSPVSISYDMALSRLDGSEIALYGASYGIEPDHYPLISGFVFTENEASFSSTLQNPEDIVITEDIATRNKLVLGERLKLVQLNGLAAPMEVQVSGILRDTPDHLGSQLFYRQETAIRLAGHEHLSRFIIALSPDIDALVAALDSNEWSWTLPEDYTASRQFVQSIFDFMLKGSGILGLLVGGIGVANTMQVLLSQRRQEIAILKTLGYSQGDMIGLFVLENLLLSSLGTVLGVILAYGLEGSLIRVFANVGTILLTWEFDGLRFLVGSLIGILTSLIFAFYAILKASEVRPSLIFRQQMPAQTMRDWGKAIGIYGLLSIPFAVITIAIFGDVVMGIGIILVAIAGFLVLGAVLSLFIWLGLKLMPSFGSSILRLARNNIRKRRSSLLFAMIALFVGIYTLGFASTILEISWEQMQSRTIESQGYNVIFYGQVADEVDFEEASQAIETKIRYIAPIKAVEFSDGSDFGIRQVEARDDAWDIRLSGEDDSVGGVWVWEGFNIPVGTSLTVIGLNDEAYPLTVLGSFAILESESILISNSIGLIVSRETLSEIAGDAMRLEWYAESNSDTVSQVLDTLPQISAKTSDSLINEFGTNFRNLFIFAVSMSGLALLASVMLIANAVGLSMLERRYEMGVMKAVGYSQGHVLLIIAYEYSLIALICSLLAVLAVEITIAIIGVLNGFVALYLFMKPQTAVIIVVLGIALSLITALMSSYQPSKVKPSIILKSE
jgi:putative ABC transport system permease protein